MGSSASKNTTNVAQGRWNVSSTAIARWPVFSATLKIIVCILAPILFWSTFPLHVWIEDVDLRVQMFAIYVVSAYLACIWLRVFIYNTCSGNTCEDGANGRKDCRSQKEQQANYNSRTRSHRIPRSLQFCFWRSWRWRQGRKRRGTRIQPALGFLRQHWSNAQKSTACRQQPTWWEEKKNKETPSEIGKGGSTSDVWLHEHGKLEKSCVSSPMQQRWRLADINTRIAGAGTRSAQRQREFARRCNGKDIKQGRNQSTTKEEIGARQRAPPYIPRASQNRCTQTRRVFFAGKPP